MHAHGIETTEQGRHDNPRPYGDDGRGELFDRALLGLYEFFELGLGILDFCDVLYIADDVIGRAVLLQNGLVEQVNRHPVAVFVGIFFSIIVFTLFKQLFDLLILEFLVLRGR